MDDHSDISQMNPMHGDSDISSLSDNDYGMPDIKQTKDTPKNSTEVVDESDGEHEGQLEAKSPYFLVLTIVLNFEFEAGLMALIKYYDIIIVMRQSFDSFIVMFRRNFTD